MKVAGFQTIQIDNNVVKTWHPDYDKLHKFIDKKTSEKAPSGTAPTDTKPSKTKDKPTQSSDEASNDPTTQCYPPEERPDS